MKPTRTPPLAAPPVARTSITLARVAEVAGVSKMTVSRVLSTPAAVSEELRKRVHAAVEATGYVPNLVAGGLRSNRTRLIACLVPVISSGSAFIGSLQTMNAELTAAGYQVLLGERGYEPAREEALVDGVLARRPDGVVVFGVMQSKKARDRLRATGIPVVEAWDMTDDPIDRVVGFSHVAAGKAIAAYLHAQGRRRVGMITATEPRATARARGFVAEARRLGLVPKGEAMPTYTAPPPSRMRHGREGVAALRPLEQGLDALYCASDLIAHGALIEAAAQGIQVPGQLAVIGFGDMDFAEDTVPPLTTLHVDHRAIGHAAATAMVARIEGGDPGPAIADLGFEIARRGSA